MGSKLDALIKKINKDEVIATVGLPTYDYVRVPFSSPRMNYCTFGGLPLGKLVEFFGEEHGGKALGLDCGILTPTGYKKMRDINVGDSVISGDGKVTKVIGVYPQGVKPMYRITFADHETIDCSDEHLWEVNCHTLHGIKQKVMSTMDLLKDYKCRRNYRNSFKYSLPTPIIYDIDYNKSLPIHPYLLGVLLGDGCLGGNGLSVSLPENDIKETISQLLLDWNMELVNVDGTYDYRIRHIGNIPNQYSGVITLKKTLRNLSVCCNSVDKHIPNEYLYTSVENRLLLLQGLYDTDGYTTKSGMANFSTSSEQLSKDFSFLVRSLGGVDMVTSSLGQYRNSDGDLVDCNMSYNHHIVFKNGIIPCSSKKHLSRYVADRVGSYYRKIVNIERIEDAECQCIMVDADCHTFIAEHEIVTHNTTTALDIVANYQKMSDAKEVLWVDVENTLDYVWATKLGVDVEALTIIKPVSQSAEEIFQMIIDAIDTGEVGLVVVDSIASMVSQQAMDKELTEKTYGGNSVAVSNFAPKAEMLCQKYQCLLIGINQIRDVIGSMFPMERTPGGRQWMHLCVARFEFKKGKYIDDKGNELTSNCENPAGNIVMMKMIKNKTCPPTRRLGSYIINYLTGIDAMRDMFDLAIKFGGIIKSGGWFSITDLDTGEIIKDKIHGQEALFDILNNDKAMYDKLVSQVLARMNEE